MVHQKLVPFYEAFTLGYVVVFYFSAPACLLRVLHTDLLLVLRYKDKIFNTKLGDYKTLKNPQVLRFFLASEPLRPIQDSSI